MGARRMDEPCEDLREPLQPCLQSAFSEAWVSFGELLVHHRKLPRASIGEPAGTRISPPLPQNTAPRHRSAVQQWYTAALARTRVAAARSSSWSSCCFASVAYMRVGSRGTIVPSGSVSLFFAATMPAILGRFQIFFSLPPVTTSYVQAPSSVPTLTMATKATHSTTAHAVCEPVPWCWLKPASCGLPTLVANVITSLPCPADVRGG